MGGQVSSPGSFSGLPYASKANADWMSALNSRLWDVPLHQLSIPGSHDTMTYCLNKKSPISSKEPRLLQLLCKVLPCVTLPVVLKWSTTQVLSVTEQLDAGVRYLDLRIAHVEDGSERNLHFVHMVYTTALVEDTLTEISEWLQSHPREVVILACRNFEGMTEDLHEYLVGCIKNIFGDMLCPRGEVPTLRQLWSRGQQVILSYEDEASVSRHTELWPGIPYWWGNKVKPQDLVNYLELMKSHGRPGECHHTETPSHTRVQGHGAGFGFKWRNGTGRVRGITLSTTGGQDVDIRADIIVPTTRGQDVGRTWTSMRTLLCPPHGVGMGPSLGSLSSLPALCNSRNS
uniref:Phosphatidylinositol specific phospholipase C X domain containing 1 n=1 Tax=Bos mutus grunniens TaxID=30521 RepID=A0A8B9WVT2_BOSMU